MNRENENAVMVFVYGTLKRGGRAEGLMEGSAYVSEGILEGYAMYSISGGAFPGIVKCDEKGAKVYGELWTVPVSSIPALDRYEGEGSLYLRRTELIAMPELPLISLEAQVYVFNRSVEGYMRVEDGVWQV